ncbi:MauE/DoxX family redox-associated membrane protein [Arcticibacter tournemirensis]
MKRMLSVIVPYLFVFLFVYTAYAKLTDHAAFASVLSKSVIIGAQAEAFAWLIPLSELAISLLLVIPKTVRAGLYASLALMLGFTIYLIIMMQVQQNLPCHCGGVISRMTWGQHIGFNTGWIMLAVLALKPGLLSIGTIKARLYTFKHQFNHLFHSSNSAS